MKRAVLAILVMLVWAMPAKSATYTLTMSGEGPGYFSSVFNVSLAGVLTGFQSGTLSSEFSAEISTCATPATPMCAEFGGGSYSYFSDLIDGTPGGIFSGAAANGFYGKIFGPCCHDTGPILFDIRSLSLVIFTYLQIDDSSYQDTPLIGAWSLTSTLVIPDDLIVTPIPAALPLFMAGIALLLGWGSFRQLNG